MPLMTCEECGREFSEKKKKCPNCGSKRVTPDWIITSRDVGPRFQVAVAQKYGDADKRVIHLSKWWWGRPPRVSRDYSTAKLNINTPEEWNAIQQAINSELAEWS